MRGALAAGVLALATLVTVGTQLALTARAGFPVGDFRAFYCAAQAASHGADPYHTEPLRACEAANGLAAFFAKNPGVTVPAPLPGYAIAGFVPLAFLPSAAAAIIWLALLVAAGAISVLTVSRFAGIPWPVPLSAFAFSLGVASIPFGEIVPIAVAAICAAGYFAWRGQWRAAAIAAAVAMVEPHLGLPVCAALAIWAPRTRVPLLAAGVAFAAISIATLGVKTNLEYFSAVLPAHALSEAGRDTQYSLTSVLTSLGVDGRTAVRAGLLSYAALLCIGVAVSGWLARKTANAAFLACVPAAFVILGGTFIHVTQMAAALPAGMLLVSYAIGRWRLPAIAALLLLTVPWILAWSPAFGLVPAFPIGYLAWHYWHGSFRAVLLAAVLAGALVVGMNRALLLMAAHPLPSRPAPTITSDLPEASWSRFSNRGSNGTLGAWLVRIPTWGGLTLLLCLLVGETRRPRPQMSIARVMP